MKRDLRNERGVALIVALMAMMMMVALGTALILTTSTESKITRNFRNTSEGLYAADAVVERAMDDIFTNHDWNNLLNGFARSAFNDGLPGGTRTLADGKTIDLGEIVNYANCRKATTCANSDMDAVTTERPWGANNPRWKPFAWGFLNDITPSGSVNSAFYAMVMVADDPSENDNNPLVDGAPPPPPATVNPGGGVISMRAEAFGPFGAHKILELTLSRTESAGYNNGVGQAGVRILSWREVR